MSPINRSSPPQEAGRGGGKEGTTPRVLCHAAREDGRRGNSLIYLLIYPSESTSCTWCSVRCDGSRKSIFTEILSSPLPRDTLSQDGEKRFLPLSYPFLRRETLRPVSERPDTKPIRPSAYTTCTWHLGDGGLIIFSFNYSRLSARPQHRRRTIPGPSVPDSLRRPRDTKCFALM